MKRTLPILIGILILAGLIVGGVLALTNNRDDQRDDVTEPAPDDPLPATEEATDLPTEVMTDEPAPTEDATEAASTEEATAEATDEPTEEATEAPSSSNPPPIPVSTEEPTEEATQEAVSNVCTEHGGTQWQGGVCVCAGVIDIVTICADGTQSDHVTTTVCTPDPVVCADGGNGSGHDGSVPQPPPQPTEEDSG